MRDAKLSSSIPNSFKAKQTTSVRAVCKSSRPTRWRSGSDQYHFEETLIASNKRSGGTAHSAAPMEQASRQQASMGPESLTIVSSRSRKIAFGTSLAVCRRGLWPRAFSRINTKYARSQTAPTALFCFHSLARRRHGLRNKFLQDLAIDIVECLDVEAPFAGLVLSEPSHQAGILEHLPKIQHEAGLARRK